jgi:hypothetical protein
MAQQQIDAEAAMLDVLNNLNPLNPGGAAPNQPAGANPLPPIDPLAQMFGDML